MGAIGLQESKFAARDQLEMNANGMLVPGRIGPATSFWQMEKNGGVAGVMTHRASKAAAQALCALVPIEFDREKIWTFFAEIAGDELAAGFARLLLLTDPWPLPAPTPANEELAWQYYLRVWRPGKPHRDFWAANWAAAMDAAQSPEPAPFVPAVAAPPTPAMLSLEERVAALEHQVALLQRY